MEHLWPVPIEKLMIWRTYWMNYQSKYANLFLRLHYDQLLITSDSKVIESLNLKNKIKGIYKENILILFLSFSGKEVRKIKFQINANVMQCLQKLGEYIPITSYNGSKTCISSKYKNIGEVLQNVLAHFNDHVNMNTPLPSEYSNFIRLCLLDPAFPQVVKETEQALKEILKK